jgi:hypothetical protein
MMALVKISWLDQSGTSHDCPARIEDTSASGACLRLKVPIDAGAKIKIDSLREQFSGVAVYCLKDDAEYLLGVQRDAKKANVASAPARPVDPPPGAQLESSAKIANTFSPPKILAMPYQLAGKPNEMSPMNLALSTVPFAHSTSTHSPATIQRQRSVSLPNPGSQSRNLQSQGPSTRPVAQPQKQSPSPGKERTFMPTKWLNHSSWRQKNETPNETIAAPEDASVTNGAAANSNSASSKLVGVQGDLLSMDDIYRAAGIMAPRMGYSITKVADMVNSDHIRGLTDEMKHASVLMALDAAGIPVEDVARDATLRQDAIDSYESAQQKHFEEFWQQKEEENALIQAEMDRSAALHLDRIKRNLDEVAREKVVFATWQTMKQQEAQRIAEAAALCDPAFASDSPRASLQPLRGLAASGKQ